MREILFRGKRAEDNKWVYGFVVNGAHSIIGVYEDGNCFCFESVIPESVGQYTGLKDKNGNKIFEGDIILTGDFWSELTYVVEWDNDGSGFNPFRRCFEVSRGCTFIYADDYEVIGNIYDNKNLLEEKQ